MVEFDERPPKRHLGVVLVDVLGVLHGASAHARVLQELHHGVAVLAYGPRREVLVEHILMLVTQCLGGQLGFARPGRLAHGRDEGLPLLVVEHGDGDPPVLAEARVDAMGSGIGVLEPIPRGEIWASRRAPVDGHIEL
jgi:hypothetical protein